MAPRRRSASAQFLAALAAQRCSARAVTSAGVSVFGFSGSVRSRPRAKRMRAKAAGLTLAGPAWTAVKMIPSACGVLRSSCNAARAEAKGSGDFSPMWAGQAASLGRSLPAGELTRALAAEALERIRAFAEPKPEDATRA